MPRLNPAKVMASELANEYNPAVLSAQGIDQQSYHNHSEPVSHVWMLVVKIIHR